MGDDRRHGEAARGVVATDHASRRMSARNVSVEAIELALDYGRFRFTRGALCFAIGRKEVAAARRDGLDLRALEGLHVVLSTDGLQVITVYRNRFLRPLRHTQRTICPWRARAAAMAGPVPEAA